MSGAFRSKRGNNSSVNYPTDIKFLSSTSITLEEAEREITYFIDQTEKWKNALPGAQLRGEDLGVGFSPVGDNSTVLSQLGRIQRDLRGLPPVVSAEPQTSNKRIKFGDDDENGTHQNKKIKFDDDEESTTVNESTKTAEDLDDIEEPKQEETQVDTPMAENEDDLEDEVDEDDDKKPKKTVEKEKKEKPKKKEKKKDEKKDKEEKKEKKEKKDKKHKKDKKKD